MIDQQAAHVVVRLRGRYDGYVFGHGFQYNHGKYILRGGVSQAVHGRIGSGHVADYAQEPAGLAGA